ncbi:MAG TPA: ROK family protein [Candidatus Kapabacteria bacterium]|nr:ROK family protein [Candidatus Kapabacteria bacterium]HOM04471.1 ROK family protein [Candidatus Kapabacteria bacterium]HPP40401.1 ROK family protein [Candidatus Kapabacteria bacterium]
MYLGVDIGGTSIKSAILDGDGLIARRAIPTEANQGVASVLTKLRTLVRTYFEEYPQIKAVGVGVPGVVDTMGNVLVSPNLPGWKNIPLLKFLRNYCDAPIAVENDANAAALAEMIEGAGRDCHSFIYVTLGTGVGGAIIYRGELFRGESSGAGEIGHTIIDYNCRNKSQFKFQQGTLEAFVGKNSILSIAKQEASKDASSKLNANENFDVVDIYNYALQGDPSSKKVLRKVGEMLGYGLASAMNLLDISTVIVGGGVANAGEMIFESARKVARSHLLPPLAEHFQLRTARHLSDTGVRGASLLGKTLIEQEF